ncbi:hypothetical protein JX266_011848 [Neoarthrinium moseri]|nr:hypothetical protein JX266_011848 [Neoarthrinium moseri]
MDGRYGLRQSRADLISEEPAAYDEPSVYHDIPHYRSAHHDLAGVGTAFDRSSTTVSEAAHRGTRASARREPENDKLSCPFRKRDPARFNIRQYQNCASSGFSDLATLKRHIRVYHRRQQLPFKCFRCAKGFENQNELADHMRAPPDQICSIVDYQSSENPEDGITDEVDMLLAERKSGLKVNSWEGLWKVLFPNDTHIPSPEFVNPKVVEISEVINAVEGFNPENILQFDINDHTSAPSEQPYHIPQLLPGFITHLRTELEDVCEGDYWGMQQYGSLGFVPSYGSQPESGGDLYQGNYQGNAYHMYTPGLSSPVLNEEGDNALPLPQLRQIIHEEQRLKSTSQLSAHWL